MSRQIPMDQPLTAEDREYLETRGRDDLIAFIDQTFSAPNDDNLGTQSPAAVSATLGESQASGQVPTLTPQTGLSADSAEGTGDGADGADRANYDDATAWSYDDLKAEVAERKEAGAEDAPALNASRETFVAWLFEDDAR